MSLVKSYVLPLLQLQLPDLSPHFLTPFIEHLADLGFVRVRDFVEPLSAGSLLLGEMRRI